MKVTFLDFEQSVSELENKIEQLRYVQDDSALDISDEIGRLQKKSQSLTKDIYAKLTPWQISQVLAPPATPLYAGLRPVSVHRFRRTARRSQLCR